MARLPHRWWIKSRGQSWLSCKLRAINKSGRSFYVHRLIITILWRRSHVVIRYDRVKKRKYTYVYAWERERQKIMGKKERGEKQEKKINVHKTDVQNGCTLVRWKWGRSEKHTCTEWNRINVYCIPLQILYTRIPWSGIATSFVRYI